MDYTLSLHDALPICGLCLPLVSVHQGRTLTPRRLRRPRAVFARHSSEILGSWFFFFFFIILETMHAAAVRTQALNSKVLKPEQFTGPGLAAWFGATPPLWAWTEPWRPGPRIWEISLVSTAGPQRIIQNTGWCLLASRRGLNVAHLATKRQASCVREILRVRTRCAAAGFLNRRACFSTECA